MTHGAHPPWSDDASRTMPAIWGALTLSGTLSFGGCPIADRSTTPARALQDLYPYACA